ncbi:MAG: type II toxin-antitoxin system HicB family antitoxin [Cyanobacterium sp. T60_A2020_053]|nr:type II toxin-antitoxin system HicB family antitoxin [Cyanobacterium sp. T60_A2020_053]
MDNWKYSMIIKWSNVDNCYLVGVPDFEGQQWRTHGDTYEEAFQNGIEVLELLIEDYQLSGETLPIPNVLTEKVA